MGCKNVKVILPGSVLLAIVVVVVVVVVVVTRAGTVGQGLKKDRLTLMAVKAFFG